MKGSMGYINSLIRDVREERELTLEAMALASDCSVSAISRWELGEREVPARYLRSLFHVTRDTRLLHYFDPAIQPIEQVKPARPGRQPPAGDPREVLPKLIEATRQLTAALAYAERIVRDGIVDESDDTAIIQSQESICQVTALMTDYNRAIMAWRDAAEKKGRS